MFVVTVTLSLNPGATRAFIPLMIANASASLAEESGCKQFDVCTDPDFPDLVFLYEVYESAQAFQDHLASTHFQAFDRDTAELVADKQVRTFREVRQ